MGKILKWGPVIVRVWSALGTPATQLFPLIPTIPSILAVTSTGHARALEDIKYVFIMAAKSSVD